MSRAALPPAPFEWGTGRWRVSRGGSGPGYRGHVSNRRRGQARTISGGPFVASLRTDRRAAAEASANRRATSPHGGHLPVPSNNCSTRRLPAAPRGTPRIPSAECSVHAVSQRRKARLGTPFVGGTFLARDGEVPSVAVLGERLVAVMAGGLLWRAHGRLAGSRDRRVVCERARRTSRGSPQRTAAWRPSAVGRRPFADRRPIATSST